MTAQAALFDLSPSVASKPEPVADALALVDLDALDRIALLYTGTEKGNWSGIRFAMSVEDAQAWCSSKTSSGQVMGTAWAYFWTSARNYIDCWWGLKEPKLDVTGIVDSGEWDARIAGLGLTKIDVRDFPAVFEPLGVEIVGKPLKGRAAA